MEPDYQKKYKDERRSSWFALAGLVIMFALATFFVSQREAALADAQFWNGVAFSAGADLARAEVTIDNVALYACEIWMDRLTYQTVYVEVNVPEIDSILESEKLNDYEIVCHVAEIANPENVFTITLPPLERATFNMVDKYGYEQ